MVKQGIGISYDTHQFTFTIGEHKGKGFNTTNIKLTQEELFISMAHPALHQFVYHHEPLIFKEGDLVLTPKRNGQTLIKVKGKTYEVSQVDTITVLYKCLSKYFSHLYNIGECTLEEYFYHSWVDMFIDPRLGLLVTRDMYIPEPLYGWTEDSLRELIKGCNFNEISPDTIARFVSYIPLADDLYQLQWLMKYGEATDYTYLKTIERYYLGEGLVPRPTYQWEMWGLEPWEDETSSCDVGEYVIEANTKEVEYIADKYLKGDINKAITYHQEAMSKGLSIKEVIDLTL